MKTRLSPGAKWTIVIVALCILCFIVVPAIVGDGSGSADPHAGHDHASESAGDDHAGESADDGHGHNTQSGGHSHSDAAHNKSAKDSCEIKQQSNGVYTYRVVSRAGHAYVNQRLCPTKPVITEISRDVICLSAKDSDKNNLSGWAIYYNVTGEGTASPVFEHVLAANNSEVAYLEGASGKFYVTVCDPFKPSQVTRTELAGLAVVDSSSNPKIEYKMLGNGDLQVSYTANGAKQVVNVNLK